MMANETTKENILIVYAHYEKKSFNAALLETGKYTLEKLGHNVVVSDLYAANFDPVMGKKDIIGDLKNPDHFNYEDECTAAVQEGRLSADVLTEQAKLDKADIVIFQFPMQWHSWPAILKGWLDRVMVRGYAYSQGKVYDYGHMKGKRAVLSITTAGSEGYFTNDGISGQIEVTLWPMHNALHFMGFDLLKPQVSYALGKVDLKTRTKMLQSWENRLENICSEQAIFLFSIHDYEPVEGDPAKGMVLKKEVQESGKRTAGQNLGGAIPHIVYVRNSDDNAEVQTEINDQKI